LFTVNYKNPRPIYEQIKHGLKQMMLTGEIAPGGRLPSVRDLAVQLAINPNTIQRAYAQLEAEGYILSVSGKGTFVAELQDQNRLRRMELEEKVRPLRDELRSLGMTAEDWAALWEGGNS